MEQVKGHGALNSNSSQLSESLYHQRNAMAHFKVSPVVGYISGPPSMLFFFLILKAESKEATAINNVASAKCLPGQIRFPYPNADVNTGSSRKVPFGLMNRSGLKISGSGYMTGS
jgi:hypothetical protein